MWSVICWLVSHIINIVIFYIADEYDPKVNPFKMPPDNDIFLLRDKERQKKKQVNLFM